MSIDPDKAFEVPNGIILSEGGAGLFSGSGSPQGFDAPVGSWYYETSGPDLWHKEDVGPNGWTQHEDDSKPRGRDHDNLLTAEEQVLSGNYSIVAKGPIGGDLVYPPSSIFTFTVEARKTSANQDMDIRLYDDTNMTELAALNFTETVDTIKEATFTLNTGEIRASVQGKKAGSNGIIVSASVVVEW